ncbi:MAG: pyridoxamine 5'-phosphate oxidase family protein [Anaerolineaceae bacterium]|nr:pyridoxamine 5'-phosphate oxidase family protein [Anaerolineaceae bacterium]
MESKEAIRAFLETQSTLTLATVDDDGTPRAAPLFYVSDDDLNLYWLSSPTSRHSLNLGAHPQVAATIYPAVWAWTAIRGLQIEGIAGIVTGSEHRESILACYQQKFNLPPDLNAIIEQSTLYTLRPTWIRWLDNSVSFGFKAEITL